MNAEGESDPSNEAQASEPCGSAMTLPVLNAAALTESGGEPVVTKYYFAGGKRVAMDRDGVVQWLVGDHGSLTRPNCCVVWLRQTTRDHQPGAECGRHGAQRGAARHCSGMIGLTAM